MVSAYGNLKTHIYWEDKIADIYRKNEQKRAGLNSKILGFHIKLKQNTVSILMTGSKMKIPILQAVDIANDNVENSRIYLITMIYILVTTQANGKD